MMVLTILRLFWRSVSSLLTLLILVGVVSLFLRSQDWPHWILVSPPSLPAGLYTASNSDSLSVGIPTIVCIPGTGGGLALSRGYVDAGWTNILHCPDGQAPMIKMLAALPGDTVHAVLDSVRINSSPWLHVPMYEEDSDGRPLEPMLGTFHLLEHECYALSPWSDRSYDSRYYGPFPCPSEGIWTALPVKASTVMAIDSLGKLLRGQ
ncbi:MAG: S26 family signal peptidase [Bacteroidetes bacterium]|nr:S26 family signal peptidase [Bacteroidota bacterium]